MPLNTDLILQRPPFNLNAAEDRAEFMQLAQALDLNLDLFLNGGVYKKECEESPKLYTEKELKEIAADIPKIYDRTFSGRVTNPAKPEYTFYSRAYLIITCLVLQ